MSLEQRLLADLALLTQIKQERMWLRQIEQMTALLRPLTRAARLEQGPLPIAPVAQLPVPPAWRQLLEDALEDVLERIAPAPQSADSDVAEPRPVRKPRRADPRRREMDALKERVLVELTRCPAWRMRDGTFKVPAMASRLGASQQRVRRCLEELHEEGRLPDSADNSK